MAITITKRRISKKDSSGNSYTSIIGGGSVVAGVSSIYGRAGAVTAAYGDYPANYISYDPISAGSLVATNVQDAIEELDSEKIGGTGTTNNLSKFTAANVLGNSQIFDNGSGVGIGTATPGAYKFNVNGNVYGTNFTVPATGYFNLGDCVLCNGGVSETNEFGLFGAGDNAIASYGSDTDTYYYGYGKLIVDGTDNRVGILTATPLATLHINSAPGALNRGIAFGDGDSGIYEGADDQIYITPGGSSIYKFTSTYINMNSAASWGLLYEVASQTNPVIVPRYGDLTTGIGSSTNGELSLIVGGTNVINMLATGFGSVSYTSGFKGTGWRHGVSGGKYKLEVDDLIVRRQMSIYELIINQIRCSNGALWVSDAMKLSDVEADGAGYNLYLDTDNSNIAIPFALNDIIRCQKWTGRGVKYYTAEVLTLLPDGVYVEFIDGDSGSVPEIGDDLVRIGNSTDNTRQGSIYLTASDSNAPYLDVMDGVTDEVFTGHIKARLGKLTGITDPLFGALSGYGLWSENVYLSGSIKATDGLIGGWNIDSDAIYTGTKKTSAGYTTSGITLASNGSVRSKYFEIDVTGGAKFKAVDSVFNSSNEETGDLDGSIAYTQANVAGQHEIDSITLTGTSGSATLSCNGASGGALFIDTLEHAAADFVTAFYESFLAAGVTISSSGDVIYFESGNSALSPGAAIVNTSGNLNGTKSDVQSFIQSIARIDTITLSGTSGRCYIVVDAVAKYLFFDFDLATTAEDFVTAYAASYAAGGVTVTQGTGIHTNDIIFTATVPGVDFTGSTIAINIENAYYGSIKIEGNHIWDNDTDDDTHGVISINAKSYKGQINRARKLLVGNGKGEAIINFDGHNSYTNGLIMIYAQQLHADNLPTASGDVATVGGWYLSGGYVRYRTV